MKLEKLINEINVIELRGDISKEVSGIQIDSRKVEKGHLFVAVKGTQTDGHDYIAKAIEKGANVIICTTYPECLAEDVTYIQVADTEVNE